MGKLITLLLCLIVVLIIYGVASTGSLGDLPTIIKD